MRFHRRVANRRVEEHQEGSLPLVQPDVPGGSLPLLSRNRPGRLLSDLPRLIRGSHQGNLIPGVGWVMAAHQSLAPGNNNRPRLGTVNLPPSARHLPGNRKRAGRNMLRSLRGLLTAP